MNLILLKQGDKLSPAFSSDLDNLRKIKDGMIKVSIRRPRNLLHHRKLFAILNCVVANSDKWPTTADLLIAIKYNLQYVEKVKLIDGRFVIVPRSIDFETLDQHSFEEFYNRAVTLCAVELGCTFQELENNSADFM